LVPFKFGQPCSKARYFVEQPAQRARDRIRDLGSQRVRLKCWMRIAQGATARNRFRRDAYHRGTLWDLAQHDRLRAYARPIPDPEWAKHLSVHTDNDAIAKRWMTLLATIKRGTAEGYALVERAVV